MKLLFVPCLAARVWAAEPLTLREAVEKALRQHPSLEAAAAQVTAAEARIGLARSALQPRVTYREGFQTSNNPVFAFGTLLTQRRFTESHFQTGSLNHPGFVSNFQSQIAAEQVLWEAGGRKSGIRAAEAGRDMAAEEERASRMLRVAQVARADYGAVLARDSVSAAAAAVRSAEASHNRAEAIRAAGMSTDADVLSVRVHLAAMREQEIRRRYDAEVAMAALCEAMGSPVDTVHDLTTPLVRRDTGPVDLAGLDLKARAARPEVRQAEMGRRQAEAMKSAARSELYPKLVARAAFEADRGRFVTQAGANWLFGAGIEWSLYNGGGSRKRIEEASHSIVLARARQRETEGSVSLQVRQARAALLAAGEAIAVAEASVAQADESLRITKNRYESGLAVMTDLLRNENALVEARNRRLAAVFEQRVAAVMLELAAGSLQGDSNVLE